MNPERGTTRYEYDENGNVSKRSENEGGADAVAVTMSYDDLNRLTGKTYSVSAPLAASWCYDGKTWGSEACSGSTIQASKGKVSEVRSDVSSTKYTYDSAGRVRQSVQATPPGMAAPYTFTYDYYLNGSLAAMTYPSQRRVTQCYDALGRVSWVSKDKQASACTSGAANPAASQAYATNVQYAGNGGATQIQYGNGLYESATYNGRQQIQTMGLGTGAGLTDLWQVQNGYEASGNNGNVQSVTLQAPKVVSGQTTFTSITTAFKYDHVNRLQRVVEDGTIGSPCAIGNGRWCQEFGYDARGNRSMAAEAGLGATAYPAQFGTNNRIADTGWSFDGRGNLKQAPIHPAAPDKYLYDGEDRLMTYCSQTTGSCADQQVSPGRTVYRYDAEGHRVEKEDSSGLTVFVYDASGNLAAEYGSVPGAGTQYLTGDHLGSIRVVTDGGQAVVARTDYEPFGRELLVTSTDPRHGIAGYGQDVTRLKFTGMERDGETGLDYFDVRYFSGTQGRFTSPDEPLASADPENPQTWSLYAYGLNNPLLYGDPSGRDADSCGSDGIDRKTGNFCTTGTARAPRGLSFLEELGLRSLLIGALAARSIQEFAEKTQQIAQPALDWLSKPRDPMCMASYEAGGAAIGFWAGGGLGSLGLAGGPAAAVTIPGGSAGGAALGGGVGGLGGLVMCSTGTGQGGGGNSAASQSSSHGFWKGLKSFRGKTKTNGLSGKAKRFFEWDHTHGDVEVYDARGNHLGSANPDTGVMTKPAVPGRRITI